MNAVTQLTHKLSAGLPLNGDDIVAALLLSTMIVSASHLLTMLITRWGDRHIAIKSLAASLLIHGVCLLGLEVFEPAVLSAVTGDATPEEATEVTTQIIVESDQNVLLSNSGNTAVADRMLPPEVPLKRFETPSPELTSPEIPEPEPITDRLESLNTTVRDVSQFEESRMTELSVAADSASVGPRQAATEDPFSELKTTFERNMADAPAIQAQRTLPQLGNPDQQARDPMPMQASAAAKDLEFRPRPEDIAMNLAARDDTAVMLPESMQREADLINRPVAPAVSDQTAQEIGLAMNRPEPRPGPATSFQSRLPRPSRAASERSTAPTPTRQSTIAARTPLPIMTDYEDVRIGRLAPEYSEAIESAAALVEMDLPTIRRRDNPPQSYQLRNVPQRQKTAEKFGGTKQSEAAVESSLKWLASVQQNDGRWDASDHGAGQVKLDENGVDRNFAGREADTGVTALVILSFLGAGYTHEQGEYAIAVDRALDWLIDQQAADGNLFGNAEHFARMYCHGMATYALAEAYGMQKQTLLGPIIDPEHLMTVNAAAHRVSIALQQTLLPQPAAVFAARQNLDGLVSERLIYSLRQVDDLRLRSALARAITFTIGQQDPRGGGWRYKFGQEGDVSMFGWQMMSLKSAEIAGVTLDQRVRTRMDSFLNSVRQGDNGGLFGYRRNTKINGRDSEPVTPVMTAEALFCQQMLGYPRDTASSRESIGFLLRNMPRLSELNYYYWYYGTLAMYQYGGRPWEEWNSVVRDTLISQQRTSGELAGSWDPADPWGRYGGRLYSTALATLTLEVYYRLLPLYRMNDAAPAAN